MFKIYLKISLSSDVEIYEIVGCSLISISTVYVSVCVIPSNIHISSELNDIHIFVCISTKNKMFILCLKLFSCAVLSNTY